MKFFLFLVCSCFFLNGCRTDTYPTAVPFIDVADLELGSSLINKKVAVTGYLFQVSYSSANSTILNGSEFNYILYSRIEHAALGLDWLGVFITASDSSLNHCVGEYVRASGVFSVDKDQKKYLENSNFVLGAIGLRDSISRNEKDFFLDHYIDCSTGLAYKGN